jgi:hypothetical protein
MKIYFAASITGGRDFADIYVDIVMELRKYGEVLTEHIVDTALDDRGNQVSKSAEEIFLQDRAWIDEADVVVAEVTQPSLGVGWELGYAQSIGKKVICLFNLSSGRTFSAMIKGNEYFDCPEYSELKEIQNFLNMRML